MEILICSLLTVPNSSWVICSNPLDKFIYPAELDGRVDRVAMIDTSLQVIRLDRGPSENNQAGVSRAHIELEISQI